MDNWTKHTVECPDEEGYLRLLLSDKNKFSNSVYKMPPFLPLYKYYIYGKHMEEYTLTVNSIYK